MKKVRQAIMDDNLLFREDFMEAMAIINPVEISKIPYESEETCLDEEKLLESLTAYLIADQNILYVYMVMVLQAKSTSCSKNPTSLARPICWKQILKCNYWRLTEICSVQRFSSSKSNSLSPCKPMN